MPSDPAPDAPLPNFGAIIGKNLTIKGIAEGSRAMFVGLLDAIAASNIQPVIDRSFGFDQAAEAYAYLASASHVGKVVIKARDNSSPPQDWGGLLGIC